LLNLILGTDWVSNQRAILDLVSKDVADKLPGRILMVPELISHDMERKLCGAAGDTCSRYAEVLSFSRLAGRVSDACGRPLRDCLDDGGRLVAMASAVHQTRSRLKAYASVGTNPDFLVDLVDIVDEFKRCCINSSDLRSASKQSEGSLAQKIEELALILEAYDTICLHGKRDPRDEMDWLLEELEDCVFAQEHVFFIDGFPDFTRQHLAVLGHLISNSPSVTISLNCDAPGSGMLAFEKAGSTALELLKIAKDAGVETTIQTITPRKTAVVPIINRVFQGEISPLPSSPLSVCRYDSVNKECAAAAETVADLVRQGCRYRDIAIVCSDMQGYRDLLDLVFKQCNIPVYISGTEDVLENFVISTVISALDAAVNGFEQQDVLRYIKSAISPLDQGTIDLIENYAILWGISGGKWLAEWKEHPDGFDGKWNEHAMRLLSLLNNARNEVIEPLKELKKTISSAVTVGQQVDSVYRYMEQIKLQRRLAGLAEDFDRRGDNRSAQILLQLWDILITALEQMYDILGDVAWELPLFSRLFKLLLSQYKVGTIPPVLDAVIVGPVSAMRCQSVKHLIILGATEGAFPGYSGSSGVLSDQERTTLRNLGIPLTGGSVDGLQAEFAEIYGVFCGATESIRISAPAGQSSFIYRRMKMLAGAEEQDSEVLGAVLSNTRAAASCVVRDGDVRLAESLGIQSAYCDTKKHADHDMESVSQERVRDLYGQRLRLSASQIDKQADCRLAYFLRYGIRATERKPLTIDPAEFGTYVHAVLENTAAEIVERGGFANVELSEAIEIAGKYSKAYAQERFGQFDSERLSYLFQRNSQELMMIVEELWRELRDSKFSPIEFELGFGDDGKLPPITVNGQTMVAEIRGFVDRVDTWKHEDTTYFRVVDYKTGKKEFDYCDVFNGFGLQMLLYLFALKQGGEQLLGGERLEAGVQYFPARVPYVSADSHLDKEQATAERNKLWKRRGLLLADEDILAAMEPGDSWYRLPCSRKKDGSLSGDIADEKQLNMLNKYVFRLLGKLVDDIASGNVKPNPYTRGSSHDACAFCPYGAVCHSAEVTGRRNYKAMSKERFWDEIEKEVKDHG